MVLGNLDSHSTDLNHSSILFNCSSRRMGRESVMVEILCHSHPHQSHPFRFGFVSFLLFLSQPVDQMSGWINGWKANEIKDEKYRQRK